MKNHQAGEYIKGSLNPSLLSSEHLDNEHHNKVILRKHHYIQTSMPQEELT